MLTPAQDAYGRAMLDHLEGREAWEIVERDDGYFYPGAGPDRYFAPFGHLSSCAQPCGPKLVFTRLD